MMRSVRLHRPGGPDALVLERLTTPRPGGRGGAGPGARGGDHPGRVGVGPRPSLRDLLLYALTGFDRDAVAADYVAVPADLLAPRPGSLGHVQSAAVPLAALSAWQGLFVHGALDQGQRVLIHGAAGGVGQFATQLARHRGARVIATTSPAGADLVRQLGAHEVLDGTGFEDAVEPVDLVFDTVGGERLARSPSVVREGGRLVSVAEEPAASGAPITTSYFVVEPDRGQLVELGRLIDRGALRVAIDSVFALEEARAAFERSLATGKRGKVVLRVAEPTPNPEGPT